MPTFLVKRKKTGPFITQIVIQGPQPSVPDPVQAEIKLEFRDKWVTEVSNGISNTYRAEIAEVNLIPAEYYAAAFRLTGVEGDELKLWVMVNQKFLPVLRSAKIPSPPRSSIGANGLLTYTSSSNNFQV